MMKKKEFCKITHVIFDMDGTLLDTEAIYTQVTQEIVGPFGKHFTWEVKNQMMGQRAPDAAKILVDSLNLPISPEEYMKREKQLANTLWPHVLPLPGVTKLVSHLHFHQIPIAVATSSYREYFQLKSQNKEWFSHFKITVVGDDEQVKRGKPYPDIFLEAAKRLDIFPTQNILVFEDAVNGVEAALAAGMSVVAVPHHSADKRAFSGAHQILDSMLHFEPTLWGLPPFDS